jgi:hypothetical protein
MHDLKVIQLILINLNHDVYFLFSDEKVFVRKSAIAIGSNTGIISTAGKNHAGILAFSALLHICHSIKRNRITISAFRIRITLTLFVYK